MGTASAVMREAKSAGMSVLALTVLDKEEVKNDAGHWDFIEIGMRQWIDELFHKPVSMADVFTAIQRIARRKQ